MKRWAASLAIVAALFTLSLAAASAHDESHGANVLFQSVTVEPDEVVDGDLTVIGGDATVLGTVHGDVTVVGGRIYRGPFSEIDGKVTSLGGHEVADAAPWLAPWAASSAFAMPSFAHENHKLMLRVATSIIVLLVFLLFPVRVRIALERVERHPGLSALAGLVAIVAVLPIALLLLLSIIGIPLIAVEIAALFAALWIGQGAIALLVGRRLYELLLPRATPTPLGALILGLVVVSAAEIVPVVGWFVTILVWLVGLGAAILAFIRDTGSTGFIPMGPRQSAPIGGPPMNTGGFRPSA